MDALAIRLRAYLSGIPEKTRQKGRRLFEEAKTDGLWEDDYSDPEGIEILYEGPRSTRMLVPSQSGFNSYEVRLSWTATKVNTSCQCPAFADYGPCKHIVAAIYQLIELQSDQNGGIEEAATISKTKAKSAADPVLFEKLVVIGNAANLFRDVDWRIGYHGAAKGELRKMAASNLDEDNCVWDFTYRQSASQRFYARVSYDRTRTLHLSCSCSAKKELCQHLFLALTLLYERGGPQYFLQFKDFSKQKAEALNQIGLQPEDPEAAEITFKLDAWGNLQMTVPEWLWTATNLASRTEQMRQRLHLKTPEPPKPDALQLASPADMTPAAVFQTATNNLPFPFELAIVNTAGSKFVKINTGNPERLPELRAALPADVYQALLSISIPHLNDLLKAEGLYDRLPNSIRNMSLDARPARLIMQQYAAALRSLWPWLTSPGLHVYTTNETRVSRNQSQPLWLHPAPVEAAILVKPDGKFVELVLQYREAETGTPIEGRLLQVAGLLLRRGDDWYLPADERTVLLMRQFPSGFAKFPSNSQDLLISQTLPSLASRYEVVLDDALKPEQIQQEPEPELHLAEQGNKYLVLVPRFTYDGQTFYAEEAPEPVLRRSPDGRWQELIRNPDAERAFSAHVRALHPSFAQSPGTQAFFIPFNEALRESWYQRMLAQMAEHGVTVTGLEDLQHFRYSPHEAQVRVSSSEGGSGIDWFDLLIEISFGEQQVSLKEVRRALMQGQAGVRLEDGSIGLLPESFLRDYGALLKLGTESKDGKLRLNKLHFTLIDTLHEAALSRDMREEIAAKKEALKGIENIRTVDVPKSIQATLRPYQAAGYHWLQVLEKLGWGGCLADDMGLGKTLQIITFLQYLKEQSPGGTHLVVCPTSLIYNWQAELDKFAPTLSYLIHYGPARVWDPEQIGHVDIVISSYGTVRSDLELLVSVRWGYVILDESQAIKNPDAQTTKAVQSLPARNRVCLSGTPLQNNTYDLYAQFEFLNPGLLGSREVFRTEFANPIDKYGEEAPRTALRRMLAPFMLRRTKEQVAKDLPDKTEVTLWCEMEKEQRLVYDEYRRFYRDSLLKRIDEDGMAGSAIYVLEALLRLRQLCDHPALVKNKSVKTGESIKLEELRREIRENAGGRKVLVFSQFTEMLAIIRDALERDGIPIAYLDGKTPAGKRQEAVEQFQKDESIRVFLISLKAGGVGLNLTAAEYVYLIDPWWNPAVEAQAIDRTHRIGQTNKIVAYRMICKDTVEEKVMQLQARKRALADGLVTEDAGFVKKLTREDVAFLLE